MVSITWDSAEEVDGPLLGIEGFFAARFEATPENESGIPSGDASFSTHSHSPDTTVAA
jgi:hypothetical protein